MPRNRAISCAFLPRSWRSLRPGGHNKEEGKVPKSGVLSGGYEGRRKARIDLGQRYGEIGISAVAAAVRYQGEPQQTAETPDDEQGRTEQQAA